VQSRKTGKGEKNTDLVTGGGGGVRENTQQHHQGQFVIPAGSSKIKKFHKKKREGGFKGRVIAGVKK